MIDELFAQDGPLASAIDGYRPRRGQIEMARAIAEGNGRQVLEAGTGIGKTFAYLAPIIQNGMTAVISTGTRALQDQLFLRDIPFLTEVLNRPVRAAMLKGRANYLCRRNLAQPAQSQLFSGNSDWLKVLEFAQADEEGDIRGAAGISSGSPVWNAAVSSRETCPVQACDFYDKCFLYRARARAREADIVVVNHALFLADLRLREEDVAELLPSRDIVVFDEAHLLPSMAPSHFGETLSAAEIQRIPSETSKRGAKASLPPDFVALTVQLQNAASAFFQASEKFSQLSVPAKQVITSKIWQTAAESLLKSMITTRDCAVDKATSGDPESGEWLATAAAKITTSADKLSKWMTLAQGGTEEASQTDDDLAPDDSEPPIPSVCWMQKNRGSISLHSAPVSGRDIFRRAWNNCENVIMTSATLSVGGSLESFTEETGMDDADSFSWPSPFDFNKRALLYLPPDMPDPNNSEYTARVIEIALPLIRANGGRAFILFSSWRALNEGAQLLQDALAGECEILKQGDAPNDELLRRFRQADNAALAGSLSFWQGVDVKGGALSLVVADKIPFSPPGDALLSARDEWRKRRGEDPFMSNQIPPAAILMKQVAGRLMRDFGDWGVFAACDPRLTRRGYGKIILSSLPPMQKTSDGNEAADFLQTMRKEEG